MSFTGIEHFHFSRDQLQHVFIVGNHKDIVALFGRLPRQGADHIVGFEPLRLQDRNAKSLQRPADERQLLSQVRGHFGAVCFVAAVVKLIEGLRLDVPLAHGCNAARAFVAEDGAAHVEHSSEILRLEVAAELIDHVDEDKRGGGRHARPRGHGALPLHRVIGAKDEGHRVQQENRRLGWGRRRHRSSVEQILKLIHIEDDSLFRRGRRSHCAASCTAS